MSVSDVGNYVGFYILKQNTLNKHLLDLIELSLQPHYSYGLHLPLSVQTLVFPVSTSVSRPPWPPRAILIWTHASVYKKPIVVWSPFVELVKQAKRAIPGRIPPTPTTCAPCKKWGSIKTQRYNNICKQEKNGKTWKNQRTSHAQNWKASKQCPNEILGGA